MYINIAERELIDKTLDRKDNKTLFMNEIYLGEMLREILFSANEFVPSESGAVFLDDPLLKRTPKERGRLYFMACFGEGSEKLTGTFLPDDVGIIGETYRNGSPYLSRDVSKDRSFYPGVDKQTSYQSRSIIAVPIKINDSVIGVIEMINRKDKINFDEKDLAILDIFARYTSTLITNALDALRFEELSKKDNLTGLYNDRYFYERLSVEVKHSIENSKPLSVIFFDLDRFKEVNDIHGHLAGSRVLKEVAQLVEDVLVGSGAVPVRYGGDEFVIVLPATLLDKAAEYAKKICDVVAGSTFIKEKSLAGAPPLSIKGLITCSIGVAAFVPPIGQEIGPREIEEGLIKAADSAMYESKRNGKNRVTCISETIFK
ncbi:MAG: sensor domain-containing diguanylate cyclase [Deltaproteobacteria bacterium]